MEAKLIGLGVETFKIALMLALPGLLTGMFLGLAVSIFQARCCYCYRFNYAMDVKYYDRFCNKYIWNDSKLCRLNIGLSNDKTH